MNVLVDTNVVARLAQPSHPQHQLALSAVDTLDRNGDVLCLVPQVLYEFWVVATRLVIVNGLGFSQHQTAAEVARLQSLFLLLPDHVLIFAEWFRLVVAYGVIGKRSHDARLVAAMTVHAITHLLTFNLSDFARYSGIHVLDAATLTLTP